jgi:hypothetical protein
MMSVITRMPIEVPRGFLFVFSYPEDPANYLNGRFDKPLNDPPRYSQ